MNNCKHKNLLENTCEKTPSCALKHKLWAVPLSLAFSLLMCMVGLLGRSEVLVAAGLYAFYQGFLCGKSILYAEEEELPGSRVQCGFVSMVAGFIVTLGALDVLVFSVWRLTKASLLVAPTPWALLVAALAMLGNFQLSRHSACVSTKPGGAHVEALRRSFATSISISALAFAGVLVGSWWPPADAIAAIIAAGMLVQPAASLFVRTKKIKTASRKEERPRHTKGPRQEASIGKAPLKASNEFL